MNPSTIVFDTEIIKAIPNKNEEPEPGIEYCRGWGDFEGMGVSVVGAYDYYRDTYHVFAKDNLPEFQALMDRREIVVGFNNWRFDDKLLKAHGVLVDPEKSVDLLHHIREGAKNVGKPRNPSGKGLGLDHCAQANGIKGKTGNGAHAPILWQQGQYGRVFDYCLHDVAMTRKLIDLVHTHRQIFDPRCSTGSAFIPVSLAGLIN